MQLKEKGRYDAIIFDLNGTMIDDMQYHIRTWHKILNDLGATLSLDRMKAECYGKNQELLERIFPGRFSEQEKNEMSQEKEKQYQREFRPHLQLIGGLSEFMQKAFDTGIKMGIGSAAIMFNINFVLDGLHIRKYLDAIVSADDVTISKPDPETFIKCAEAMAVLPGNCVVFEDSPKGVEAGLRAGMDCVVITTMHKPDEFLAYTNVIAFIDDFNNPLIKRIF